MPTADEFAHITNKKLMGFVDFDVYLLKYLRTLIRATTERLFVQGAFDERMPLLAAGAKTVAVGLKPTLLDGFAHDGSGRLLNLEAIDRTATFEGVSGQVYEVGAQYIEFPREIRINPRTGKPEYDRFVEGIGVQAAPNEVAVGGGALTFVVDSLFELNGAGASLAVNHTGRSVRVFRVVPGDVALTAPIAIDVRPVFFDGKNKITVTGNLGQTSPESSPNAYVVQLIGLTVMRNSASNRPSQRPKEVFFIGTVAGNGGTPSVFNTAAQNIIWGRSAATVIAVTALANWADGTTNPATNLTTALAKFVTDLTSTTGSRGAGKITAPALTNWADGTTNPAVTTGSVIVTVAAALAKIVTDLTSTTALRGAGKITAPALTALLGTLNPGAFPSVPAQGLAATLQSLLGAINAEMFRGATRSELVSIHTLTKVYTNPTWPIRDITASTDGSGQIATLFAVGDNGTLLTRGASDSTWTKRTPAGGYVGNFNAITIGNVVFAVGNAGCIQTTSNLSSWSSLKSTGNNFQDIAYRPNSPACSVAVGDGGFIFEATGSTSQAADQRTGAPGTTSEDYRAIAYGAGLFVVTTSAGKIMVSPMGATGTWTVQSTLTGTSPTYLVRQLQYSARHGFVALYTRNSGEIGVSRSTDGITWTHSASQNSPALDEANVQLVLLDQLACYLWAHLATPPFLLNAIAQETVSAPGPDPGYGGVGLNILDIAECLPMRAKNIAGFLYVVGKQNNGDGVVLCGAPFRPNFEHPFPV